MELKKFLPYLLAASLFLCLNKVQAQDVNTLPEDVKLTVQSATASEHQNGEDIDKSYDGDVNTLYHSKWSGATFPVVLTYNFANVDMDYIQYIPRQDQENGIITKCKITVKKSSGPDYVKNLTFPVSHSAKVISFPEQQKNVTKVIFRVTEGKNNFVSCAEMEFYKSTSSSFNYADIFTDATCSELKAGVTQSNIDAISIEYYRTLATDLLNNNYSKEFRVQEYKAWPHPSDFSRNNRVGTYSLCDNPTGIYAAAAGEKLAVFVGDKQGYDLSLVLKNFDAPGGDGYYNNQTFTLKEGLNVITTTQPGLFYLFYHTPEHLTAPNIKVHIAYGKVNGYFDSQKHTKADWSRILNATPYKYFDILGKYAHISFETQLFKTNAANNGDELIAAYDSLVHQEREFMGYYKYNRNPYNRSHFTVMYKAYMYSAGNHTAYNINTLDGLTKVEQFKKTPWGPAHEVGHSNQHTPLFKWVGMTECTNNVQSLLIQTSWGNRSRLSKEDKYQAAYEEIVIPKKAHCEPVAPGSEQVWWKLVPFWQLKLYFHDVLGRNDFYKDIYQECRIRPVPMDDNGYDDGECQLEFVRIVSDVAQMDLTEFFETWGFLKPIDMEVDDYSKAQLTITEAQSQATKDHMKQYSEKPDMIIQYLTDDNLDIYKEKKEVVKGTYTIVEENSSTYIRLSSEWKNYVAVEVYHKCKLINVERQGNKFRLPPVKNISVYAVQYDGKRILVKGAKATSVNLDATDKTVHIGGEFTLTPIIEPDSACYTNLTWSSSNTTVATVDNTGKVTAIAEGTTEITVTTEEDNLTAKCTVTVVKDAVQATGVKLDVTDKTIKVGDKFTLTATVEPDNATNTNLIWSTSDAKIATVDNIGRVTALAKGKATITVKTEDGNFTATCKVTVSKATAIEDLGNTLQFGVYPTIVNNGFTVEFTGKFNNAATLEIYSLSGKKVHTERINRNKQYINVSDIQSGTYIVRLGSKSCKIVKQ